MQATATQFQILDAIDGPFRDLCREYDVHSVQVGLLLPNDRDGIGQGWSVGIQKWIGNSTPVGCWSESGKTPLEALQKTLAKMLAENPDKEALRAKEIARLRENLAALEAEALS